jgi:hypothetical protein
MRLPRPKLTIRQLMTVVAIVGLMLGLVLWMERRSAEYRRKALFYEAMSVTTIWPTGSPPPGLAHQLWVGEMGYEVSMRCQLPVVDRRGRSARAGTSPGVEFLEVSSTHRASVDDPDGPCRPGTRPGHVDAAAVGGVTGHCLRALQLFHGDRRERGRETLRFSAAATDAEGRDIADDLIHWEVYCPPVQLSSEHAAKALAYVVPAGWTGPRETSSSRRPR